MVAAELTLIIPSFQPSTVVRILARIRKRYLKRRAVAVLWWVLLLPCFRWLEVKGHPILTMPKDKPRKPKAKDKPYCRTSQENSSSEARDDEVEVPSVCPVCEQVVKEPSDDVKDPGDEALFCEGKCEAWYHRKCVGLSKCAYDSASESDTPFYCLFCMQMFYNNVIAELKDQISSLTSKLNQSLTETTSQPPAIPTLDYNPAATTTSPSSSANAPPHKPSAPVASSRQDSTRKFNIVLFGLEECSKGTKKIDREKADLNNAAEVLTGLENTVQPHSIRDTIRLGKITHQGDPGPY